jgi:MFS family permease
VLSGVFAWFLVARTIAMAGTALSLVALPIQAYRLTGSASLTALLTAVQALPYLLLGLPVGALADRWNRRRMMVVPGLISAVLMLSLPAADHLNLLSYGYLVVVAAGVGIAFVCTDAASFGAVPQMVGRDRMPEATSALVTASTVTGVAGPPVAGLLVSVTSPALVLGLDGVAFLVAALLTARLRWPGSESTRPSGAGVAGLAADVGEGLAYIWRQPLIRTLTLLGTAGSLAGGAAMGLIVVLGVEQLGLDRDDPRLGLLFTAGAVGSLLAGLALPFLQRRIGVGLISLAGFVIAGLALAFVASSNSAPSAAAALLVYQAASTALIVNGIATRQVLSPSTLQSRVNTTARLIAWGGAPLGAVIGGGLADVLGVAAAYRFGAGCLALAAIVGLLARLDQQPTLLMIQGGSWASSASGSRSRDQRGSA